MHILISVATANPHVRHHKIHKTLTTTLKTQGSEKRHENKTDVGRKTRHVADKISPTTKRVR